MHGHMNVKFLKRVAVFYSVKRNTLSIYALPIMKHKWLKPFLKILSHNCVLTGLWNITVQCVYKVHTQNILRYKSENVPGWTTRFK
jgi:hypothetical protein